MDLLTVLLLGVGLAMDAFAVSLCKGLAFGKVRPGQALVVGIWFGVFQAIMPIIGFFLGRSFYDLVSSFAYWVAFLMLLAIGLNMFREALFEVEEGIDSSLGFRIMLFLAVATSIDALAVGITFACTGFDSLGSLSLPLLLIGIISFALSLAGFLLGVRFGEAVNRKVRPELVGGIILIGIGLKILLEHLGYINF